MQTKTTTDTIINSAIPAAPSTLNSLAAPKPGDGGPTLNHPSRHRNGHVARLPKEIRQRINQMLDDGLPYAQIIKNLGPKRKKLDTSHIGSWKTGG